MKKVTEVTYANELEALEFELKKEEKKLIKNNYVNNKELFAEFEIYHENKMRLKEEHLQRTLKLFGFYSEDELENQPSDIQNEFKKELKQFTPPPLPNKIGQAILDISHRRCYSPRFVNYAPNWKEEMISDAIETCIKYAHNFNPNKSDNPFAYLTQLVTNAIFQRIKKEHKQQYIKLKLFDNSHGFVCESDENFNNEDVEVMQETNEMYQDRLEYIDKYEKMQGLDKKKGKRSKKSSGDNILDMD